MYQYQVTKTQYTNAEVSPSVHCFSPFTASRLFLSDKVIPTLEKPMGLYLSQVVLPPGPVPAFVLDGFCFQCHNEAQSGSDIMTFKSPA